MSELGEVKRAVAEYEAKGNIDRAVAELESAVQEFPKEGSLFNKLGDLYLKVNRETEALDVYERGARVFKEETYFPNAIALCKKILRIRKDRPDVYMLLGELHKELDQRGEAANYFLEYAEMKMQENELESALSAYNIIKELVPNNPKILETISAIYEKVGKKEAGEELKKEAQELESKQEKIREQILSEAQAVAEPTAVEETAVEEKVEEEKVEEAIVEEPTVEESLADTDSVQLDNLVSPEIAELLKDDDVEVEEEEATEDVEVLSEIDKTIELGELYLNLGSEEEACDCFASAADEAWNQKDFNTAQTLNNKIANLRPFDLESRKKLIEIAKIRNDKRLQIESMLSLAEALNRRDAKSEARSVYEKVLALDAGNTVARDMLAAFEQPKDYIDLGEVLRTELDSEKKVQGLQSIDELVSQFRREVFESIGEGDYRSRYDLGVAYKGMGLFQEAIEEFEIALKDPELKLKAMEMIASCFLERGKIEDAIRVLRDALRVKNRPRKEYFGIFFMLGNCYEQQNKMREALQAYVNAGKIDRTVPDLRKKISHLKDRLTKALKQKTKEKPIRETVRRTPTQTQTAPEQKKQKKSKITYL
ncbi:MAG: tetratricopeptide repeat protein [candidate division WOR-3 bacterium]|nr:MAG: tetratricopeptide repeat protein [candidate division WOR-3 bacterium]